MHPSLSYLQLQSLIIQLYAPAFASKHISEDDDEWRGLLHLAPINEAPLSPAQH